MRMFLKVEKKLKVSLIILTQHSSRSHARAQGSSAYAYMHEMAR